MMGMESAAENGQVDDMIGFYLTIYFRSKNTFKNLLTQKPKLFNCRGVDHDISL